jgi:hypothetical protein
MPEPVSFAPIFAEALEFVGRCVDQDVETKQPRTMLDILLADSSKNCDTGDKRLANIREMLHWLDENGHERSPQQCELQEAFLKATARIIYKNEFDDNVERIMMANAWEKLYQEVLIGTPRRFGKTYSTAMYATVFMLAVPDCKVCIYSTGKNTAAMVLDHIRTFFRELPCYADFTIITDNEKVLQIAPRDNPLDRRVVKSFTSNPKMSSECGISKDGAIIIYHAMDTVYAMKS